MPSMRRSNARASSRTLSVGALHLGDRGEKGQVISTNGSRSTLTAISAQALIALVAGCATNPPSQIVQRGTSHSGDGYLGLLVGQSKLQSDDAFPVDQEH